MRNRLRLSYIKSGDWLIIGISLIAVAWCYLSFWVGGTAERVIVRSGGKVFAELSLSRDRTLKVPGPLGETIIAIHNRRAHIAADPSPRQYCVRQGWLTNPGEMAICLPNQVSLELIGKKKDYDSLNY